jgi:hypothetical protein
MHLQSYRPQILPFGTFTLEGMLRAVVSESQGAIPPEELSRLDQSAKARGKVSSIEATFGSVRDME